MWYNSCNMMFILIFVCLHNKVLFVALCCMLLNKNSSCHKESTFTALYLYSQTTKNDTRLLHTVYESQLWSHWEGTVQTRQGCSVAHFVPKQVVMCFSTTYTGICCIAESEVLYLPKYKINLNPPPKKKNKMSAKKNIFLLTFRRLMSTIVDVPHC